MFTLPKDRKSIVAALSNRYFMGFDNLQVLSQWMSDLFCNVSTGGTEPMRQLFTDNQLKGISIKGCVCLNGLDVVVTKKDLLDRAILLELDRIPPCEVKTEHAYFAALSYYICQKVKLVSKYISWLFLWIRDIKKARLFEMVGVLG